MEAPHFRNARRGPHTHQSAAFLRGGFGGDFSSHHILIYIFSERSRPTLSHIKFLFCKKSVYIIPLISLQTGLWGCLTTFKVLYLLYSLCYLCHLINVSSDRKYQAEYRVSRMVLEHFGWPKKINSRSLIFGKYLRIIINLGDLF